MVQQDRRVVMAQHRRRLRVDMVQLNQNLILGTSLRLQSQNQTLGTSLRHLSQSRTLDTDHRVLQNQDLILGINQVRQSLDQTQDTDLIHLDLQDQTQGTDHLVLQNQGQTLDTDLVHLVQDQVQVTNQALQDQGLARATDLVLQDLALRDQVQGLVLLDLHQAQDQREVIKSNTP